MTNPEDLNIDEESWIGSLASVGALIGTVASQVATRYSSARHGLILSSVGSVLGWSLIFAAAQESIIAIIKDSKYISKIIQVANPKKT